MPSPYPPADCRRGPAPTRSSKRRFRKTRRFTSPSGADLRRSYHRICRKLSGYGFAETIL